MLLMPQQQQILGLIDLSSDYIQPMESASAASTSRRSAPFVSPSPLTPDFISCFHGQGFELDALIRLQVRSSVSLFSSLFSLFLGYSQFEPFDFQFSQKEKIRLGMEEAKKRHFVSLLSSLEITVIKSLKEKETELVNLRRRNAGLEEIVKEMMAENQIWCQVAKNNEAIVSDLRMSLERILSRDSGATEEGYGDSDAVAVVADDARSFCYEAEGTVAAQKNGELRLRRTCKACRGKDVSVLLLPCRHLCLCKECEWSVGFCPVCKSKKNASLQIFM